MAEADTREHLLDAALRVIASEGLHGMTMRAIAAEADCALGLLNYHFDDKDALIVEAFQRIVDRLMSTAGSAASAAASVDAAVEAYIQAVFSPDFLTTNYLSLRLSLWAATASEPLIAEMNSKLDADYWSGLCDVIAAARPQIELAEITQRATDVIYLQNGVWLTWVVRPDQDALARIIERCRQIALA